MYSLMEINLRCWQLYKYKKQKYLLDHYINMFWKNDKMFWVGQYLYHLLLIGRINAALQFQLKKNIKKNEMKEISS